MKTPGKLLPVLACAVISFIQTSGAVAADFTAIWNGGTGNWSDPLQWNTNPNYPNNTGGITYDAAISHGFANLDVDVVIQRLSLGGSHSSTRLTGSSQLTLNEGLTWTGGDIALGPGGAINLAVGSTSTLTSIPGSNYDFTSGTINNAGNFTLGQTSALFGTNGTINNLASGTWTMKDGSLLGDFGLFNNAGTFVVEKAVNGNAPFVDCVFNNNGTVNLNSATAFNLALYRGGSASGTFNIQTGFGLGFGTISTVVHPYTFTTGAAVIGGGTTTIGDSGSLIIAGNSSIQTSLVNRGTLTVESGATLSLSGAFTQIGATIGTTRLNGGTITSVQPLNLQFGTLTGSGTINGNVNLLSGALTFQLGGTMAGIGANNYDSIGINGSVALGGNLQLTFKSGFENTVTASDKFTVLNSSSPFNGSFANVASGSRLDTTDGFGSFIVGYAGSTVSLTNFLPNTRWLGGSGNWTNGVGWSSNPNFPNNTPSTHYSVAINTGTVTLDANITISRFLLTGGNLTGGNSLTIDDRFIWTAGVLGGSAGSSINLGPKSISTISSGYRVLDGRTINNSGTLTQDTVVSGGLINNLAGATWYLGSHIGSGTFNNSGNLIDTGYAATGLPILNNNGNVRLLARPVGDSTTTLTVSGGSATGTFDVPERTQLLLYTYTFNTGATIAGTGLTSLARNFTVAGNSTISTSLTNFGMVGVDPGVVLTLNGSFTQTQTSSTVPMTQLHGGTITSAQPLNFQGGSLVGSGTINGNVINNAIISPGASAGMLGVNGNISLLNSSKLVMEIGGVTQGIQYDYVAVSGMVGLDGTLELHMLNGFQLKLEPGQIFTLLTSNSLLEGVFDNIANGARLTTSDGLASFQVNYGAGSKYGANNLVLSDPRAVPEPASVLLFVGGALAFTLFRARRR
jgi:hypothetical protein